MALIWPNIVRYSLVGSYGEQEIVNILDCEVQPVPLGTTSRVEAIPVIAGDIINQWAEHVMPLMHANYQLDEVRYVDLDTANGITGSRTSTDAYTLPYFASGSGQGMPGNVYIKVVKSLDEKTRLQRNGMLRLSAVREGDTVDGNVNRISPERATSLNAAFEDLKDGINGEDEIEVNLGVLHTVNNTATGFSRIGSFSTQQGLGTIRRRMPGYGN